MRAKSVLSMVLLLFVAFAVGAVVSKAVRQNSVGSSAGDSSPGASPQAVHSTAQQPPASAGSGEVASAGDSAARTPSGEPELIVYYFHATRRCPTCRKIEIQAHEAIGAAFGPMLADGRLRWETRNFEERENDHFVTEFQLVAPNVVVAKQQGGRVVAWEGLDKVWDLVLKPDAYREYVQKEIRAFIEVNMPEVLSEPSPGGDTTGSAG